MPKRLLGCRLQAVGKKSGERPTLRMLSSGERGQLPDDFPVPLGEGERGEVRPRVPSEVAVRFGRRVVDQPAVKEREVDRPVRILEFRLEEQGYGRHRQAGFFEAFPYGTVRRGLVRITLSTGKLRLTGERPVRSTDSDENRLPSLDDGNANSDHRGILGK